MRSRIPQLIATLFLIALLAAPQLFKRLGSHPDAAAVGNTASGPDLNRYGFRLQEVAHAAGIDFTHQAPKLDPKLDHIMPEIASMGAAVSVVDFDRDGWPDLYVTNSGEGSLNHLYRNQHDGTFRDVAAQMGVADVNKDGTGVSMGAVWGDYDNDGYEDLFIYKWGRPELFHNDKGKRFSRVTDTAGLPQWVNSNSAIWLDYDRDGKLDLFLTGYYPETVDLWHLKDTHMMPDSFEYAQNGGRKYLLRNMGNGKFKDVTAEMGIDSHRWALATTAADLRGTGYPDIFIANDYGVSEIWANQNGKGFKEIGKQALYWNKARNIGPKSGMNANCGDVLNRGQFAVYVSNITENGLLMQGNNLWVPQAGTSGDNLKYDNLAGPTGVENGGWSFGAQFGDLNNDGNLDLYLTNGYVSAAKKESYWYAFTTITGGNSAIISDAKNWPPMQGRSLSGYEHKHVWLNDGTGSFSDVAQAVGVTDTYDGRAVALADFWNRGALDVAVATQRGPFLLYKNEVTPQNQWTEFTLEGAKSNRSAIGAQVRLFWNGQQQLQEVSGGNGFCAQNERRLHFGLGKHPKIEKAVIRWPSGQVQTLQDIKIGQENHIKEAV
ncbi:MAG: CRTAC1 family protein [Abitibacteriaceae bacterium]|nr:CRTAC1 family protein [Abditibacteriaceae bacterium]